MTRDHYRSPADLTGSRSKIKTRPEDGRPDYLLDKITTVSGIRNDVDDSEGFERLVLDGSGLATQTTGVSHYYANGTSGDDANDGLSEATPKKTLQAVFDLVPYLVKHNTCVHLAGTFTSFAEFGKSATGNASTVWMLIDGGSDTTVVADDSGSPWAADVVSATNIGLTTLSWTPDQYAGYWVEVVTGPAAGQTRLIASHDGTTITPVRSFSVSPGAAAQFRIVRPSTEITANVRAGIVGTAGNTTLRIQGLYFSGTASLTLHMAGWATQISHIVSNSSAATCVNTSNNAVQVFPYKVNASTFSAESTTAYSSAGLSVIGSSTYGLGGVCSNLTCYGSYLKKLSLTGGHRITVAWGSRIESCILAGLSGDDASSITTTAGYATTKFGTSGIVLYSGSLRIGAGVDISNCTSHGVECNHSRLHLDGAVTGTGNGGAAVYAHNGSVVNIKNGAPPTISGTLGHLSTDGTTNATWWSTLDAGTPLAVLAEMTMAKEVP